MQTEQKLEKQMTSPHRKECDAMINQERAEANKYVNDLLTTLQ